MIPITVCLKSAGFLKEWQDTLSSLGPVEVKKKIPGQLLLYKTYSLPGYDTEFFTPSLATRSRH
jgi:hypothetical protein